MSRRYRAFISYSHEDEAWAAWLHRALESYRIPKHLVGRPGRHGPVPRRLHPVFRDREDLASAAHLSEPIRRALEDSDALIVVCSPAAAASQWVNEEIRQFRSLGREGDIHCLIVDGDPQSEDVSQQCFPPALLEATEEPLAADARPWADGRQLARLKLLAGILGLRLDELRRRDLQRRHRVWALSTGGALLVALVTSVLAVLAVQARNAEEKRRAHAEELVGYMLGDLRQKLDEVGRLDILDSVGSEARAYLETLDPREITDESLEQTAKAWRQLGEVSFGRGDLPGAMDAFQRSLVIQQELQRRHPDATAVLFELGNAEFWVGYVHYEQGDYDAADESFQRYMAITRRLVELEPGEPDWLMEMAYAHANLAILERRRIGADQAQILQHSSAAVDYNQQALERDPGNAGFAASLHQSYADLADALLDSCRLGEAFQARMRAVDIISELASAQPGNAALQLDWAYALAGFANLQRRTGLVDEAMASSRQAARMIDALAAADPSNANLQWQSLWKAFELNRLVVHRGSQEDAWATITRLSLDMGELASGVGSGQLHVASGYGVVLTDQAEMAYARGDRALGDALRDRALRQFADVLEQSPEDYDTRWRLTRALVTLRPEGSAMAEPPPGTEAHVLDFADPGLTVTGCNDADLAARLAFARNDLEAARQHVDFLMRQGYWDPDFQAFCRDAGLCVSTGSTRG